MARGLVSMAGNEWSEAVCLPGTRIATTIQWTGKNAMKGLSERARQDHTRDER